MTVSQEECPLRSAPHQPASRRPSALGCEVCSNRADGSSFARARGHKTARRWAPSEMRCECGHTAYSFNSGSLEDCPDDGVSVPALHTEILPIGGSFKRRASFGVSYPTKDTRT